MANGNKSGKGGAQVKERNTGRSAKTEVETDEDEDGEGEGEGGGHAGTVVAKKPKTLILGIGSRGVEMNGLTALAEKLNCRVSDLLWEAARRLVENPPTERPASASVNRGFVGSSPGYVVAATTDSKGRATAFRIVEVETRQSFQGEQVGFYRFKDGDPKSKARALGQAQKAAAFQAKLIGQKGSIEVESEEAEA